ncbi:MAG: LacI family DNA-binding transcriptional regulator [Ignavibacteria bacterium]|jgi:LacI family transcriptional regulator
MTDKPITLKDIAKQLGVSVVTVSKALRDHPDVSLDRTRQIKELAKELGYTPNIMARGLSSRRTNTIGVIVPKIAHFFFGSIIEHIYHIAFDNNYEIILTVSQENAEREKMHIQSMLSMKVDGIIISISQETKDYEIFETIKRRGIPIVYMDRIPEISDINSVSVNDREGAYRAVEHAIKIGYTKIAHFAGYNEINIGYQRCMGFKQAMNDYGIPIEPDWLLRGGFGETYGYNAFMDLYKRNRLPDLIFAVTYPVALGVYSAANQLNLRIPEDIDLICFGNAKVQKFFSPPMSCVDQPTDQLAKESMNILLNNIFNSETSEPKQIVLDSNLILRGTCTGYKKSNFSPIDI